MDPILCAIIFLLAGLALGGGIMWLAGRVRAAHAGVTATILGERLAEREREIGELSRLREEQTRAIDSLNERVTGLTGELRAWQAEAERVPPLEAEIRNLSEQLRRQAEQAAGLEVALTKERQASQEKEALLDEARAKLMDTFKALASEALSRNNESFLQLAMQNLEKEREAAKGELDKKHQAIGELVGPLREQLARYEQQMSLMEKERNQSYGKLLEQVTKLDLTQ
jgi:DNA recombination protein RmuC